MMKLKVTLFGVLTAVSLGIVAPYASGAERVKVCADYKNTNKSYLVTATLMSSYELNNAVGSNKYEPHRHYAVIFWAENQASIIKLDEPAQHVSLYGTKGWDQNGYRWRLSQTTMDYCRKPGFYDW